MAWGERNAPRCEDDSQVTRPGLVLRAVAGLCLAVPLVAFTLCLVVFLLFCAGLVTGLFT
jgi:hypothetical protein